MNIPKINSFLYSNYEVILGIIEALDNKRISRLDFVRLRMYKFSIAIYQLEKEGELNFPEKRRFTRKDEKRKKETEYKQSYNELKKEALMLDSSRKNLIFFEQVDGLYNIFYFYNYIEEEIIKPDFYEVFSEFCEELGLIPRKAS